MLNLQTHRVTSLEDAEESVSTNVSRWREQARTQAMVYRPERRQYHPLGCDNQGRSAYQPTDEERLELNRQAQNAYVDHQARNGGAAHAASELDDTRDAETQMLMPWLTAKRFWWAYGAAIAAGLVGLHLWVRFA